MFLFLTVVNRSMFAGYTFFFVGFKPVLVGAIDKKAQVNFIQKDHLLHSGMHE